MKYYLDLGYGDKFELKTIDEDDTVYAGHLSDLGIQDNDPEYTNKLDDFFTKELGIAENEWEIG